MRIHISLRASGRARRNFDVTGLLIFGGMIGSVLLLELVGTAATRDAAQPETAARAGCGQTAGASRR
ncbi:MAG: hypothetical protein ABIV92_16610 [Thermoflexales bacterium]